MQLRPDQEGAIDKAYGCAKSGAKRILLVAPTGFGKTVTLSEFVRRARAKNKRVVWAAHRRELCRQAFDTLCRFNLDAGWGDFNRNAPVQVMSTQGALRRDELPPGDLVILDEAHHYVSEEWGKLPTVYPNATILGATATPERGDGTPMSPLFQQIVVCAQPRELQQVMQPGGFPVLVPWDIKRPRRQLRGGRIAKRPVDAYHQYARGERAVLFARSIEDAERHVSECRMMGVRADVVHERLSSDARDSVLAKFHGGELDIVANVAILTEGWDCPACSVVILARGCGSTGLYLQMAGRGGRGAKGKTRALLLDLTGASYAHGRPDDDREYSLDGDVAIRRKGDKSGLPICRVCGTLIVDGACDCGRAQAERKPTEVVEEELFDWKAEIRKDTDDRQAERLAKWLREARAGGKDTRSALHKFNGVYGRYPNRTLVAEAERIAAEYIATQARIAALGPRQQKIGGTDA